ncbi:MAG: hypothetical protein HLX51_01235 [Micrococcaceae bacterium]|nr:hypothetical protein [Micrococcaceae bacterium]
MTTFALPQNFPPLPDTGRKLFTYDDLADEIEVSFLPGQYVHLEQWTTGEHSDDIVDYTMIEGYIYEGYDWEFLNVGQIDHHGEKVSEKRHSIALTGHEGTIKPTVTATGTLVIPDPSEPNVTYQVTARKPVFGGPAVTGCLTNDLGQESPYDLTELYQVWIDVYDDDVQRHHTMVERTVYRHDILDGDGTLLGCVETSDGGQSWGARKWYSFDQQYDEIEGFEPTASITDNAQSVYLEAGGTGRWTKRTMVEVPLPFEMVA